MQDVVVAQKDELGSNPAAQAYLRVVVPLQADAMIRHRLSVPMLNLALRVAAELAEAEIVSRTKNGLHSHFEKQIKPDDSIDVLDLPEQDALFTARHSNKSVGQFIESNALKELRIDDAAMQALLFRLRDHRLIS